MNAENEDDFLYHLATNVKAIWPNGIQLLLLTAIIVARGIRPRRTYFVTNPPPRRLSGRRLHSHRQWTCRNCHDYIYNTSEMEPRVRIFDRVTRPDPTRSIRITKQILDNGLITVSISCQETQTV